MIVIDLFYQIYTTLLSKALCTLTQTERVCIQLFKTYSCLDLNDEKKKIMFRLTWHAKTRERHIQNHVGLDPANSVINS